MSEFFPLPTEPESVISSLVERFNSGNVEAMMALYAAEAVFIAKDGRTVTDRSEIAAQFQRDMSLGLPLTANVRHVFVGDDTARIVVDWSIDGKGPGGEDVHLGGSEAISCAAARIDSGGTLSTTVKGRQCGGPPDTYAPRLSTVSRYP